MEQQTLELRATDLRTEKPEFLRLMLHSIFAQEVNSKYTTFVFQFLAHFCRQKSLHFSRVAENTIRGRGAARERTQILFKNRRSFLFNVAPPSGAEFTAPSCEQP